VLASTSTDIWKAHGYLGKIKQIVLKGNQYWAIVEWLVPSNQINERMDSTTARVFLNTAPEDTVFINTQVTQNVSYPVAQLYRINHALTAAGIQTVNHATTDLRKEITEERAYYQTKSRLHSLQLPRRGRVGQKPRQMEVLVIPTTLLDQLFMEAYLLTQSKLWPLPLLKGLQAMHQFEEHHEQALGYILGAARLEEVVNQTHKRSANQIAQQIQLWVWKHSAPPPAAKQEVDRSSEVTGRPAEQ